MDLFTSLSQQTASLRQLLGEVPETEQLPEVVAALADSDVVVVLEAAAALARTADQLRVAASGVIAQRSTRASGHAGLAQSLGHRGAAGLIQQVTGASRAQANRDLRVGESLFEQATHDPELLAPPLEFDAASSEGDRGPDCGEGSDEAGGGLDGGACDSIDDADRETAPEPWHAPLRAALLSGRLTSEQHDAILASLGEPPTDAGSYCLNTDAPACECDDDDHSGPADPTLIAQATEAWRLAATRLLDEASRRTVEELRREARSVRDLLDPVGCARRYSARYEARSFRMWVDPHGAHRGSFSFDDESAAWVRAMVSAAMRPRRGGPRFVDPDEQEAARELRDDPRTNDQLAHDLMIDVLHAGSLATVKQVFGVKQAGVRVVKVVDAPPAGDRAQGGPAGSARTRTVFEDDGAAAPANVAERTICNTGAVDVTVDRAGNPLDVGREARLYQPKQRIALSLRDGGCMWTDCDRPPSYCEAHHIDEWVRDGGRTDIDRGILLCRFHHMQLHNGGWRITREGRAPFILHSPDGTTRELTPRTARQLAWAGLSIAPSVAFRPGAAKPPSQVPPEAWVPWRSDPPRRRLASQGSRSPRSARDGTSGGLSKPVLKL